MKRRFRRLALAILALLLGGSLFEQLPRIREVYLAPASNPEDVESYYAQKLPYPLGKAGRYELEMIPGISNTLAARILERKDELLVQNDAHAPFQSRLEEIKGIGPKGALRLLKYLTSSPKGQPELAATPHPTKESGGPSRSPLKRRARLSQPKGLTREEIYRTTRSGAASAAKGLPKVQAANLRVDKDPNAR